MRYSAEPTWLNHFVRSDSLIRSGQASSFYRSFRAGEYLRLAEGVFLARTLWQALDVDERFAARVHAVALASRPGIVFSHLSAAALWRLPMTAAWPEKPEVVVGTGGVGVTRRAYNARRFEIPDPEVIDGISVTPLARTLVDVGRSSALSVSVAMMDRALAPRDRSRSGPVAARTTRAALRAELAAFRSPRGIRRCGMAIDLADGASGSAGESLSRVGMHVLGLPNPILQQQFSDHKGLIGFVDFWWPEFNLVGEFDGRGKYLRDELTKGRSTAAIVLVEKSREDRLRSLDLRVTR